MLYSLLVFIMLFISLTDLYKRRIPDTAIVSGILLRTVGLIIKKVPFEGIVYVYLSSLFFTLPVLLVVVISEQLLKKTLLGGGDIKLIFMLSLWLPLLENLEAFLTALFSGLAAMLILEKYKHQLPFGIFLCLGWSVFGTIFYFL